MILIGETMRIVCADYGHVRKRATLGELRRDTTGWSPLEYTDTKGVQRRSRNLWIEYLEGDDPVGRSMGGLIDGWDDPKPRMRFEIWCPLCKLQRSYRAERLMPALDRYTETGARIASLGALEALL